MVRLVIVDSSHHSSSGNGSKGGDSSNSGNSSAWNTSPLPLASARCGVARARLPPKQKAGIQNGRPRPSASLRRAALPTVARSRESGTGVCEKHIPFTRALAMQSSGGNRSPAPDLLFRRAHLPRSFLLRRSVFFTETGINRERIRRASSLCQ